MNTRDILQFHRKGGGRGRHTSSAQIAVSARLDVETVRVLEEETATSGIRRNSLLNMAAQWYVSELDHARRDAASGVCGDAEVLDAGMIERYLLRSLSCSQLGKLRHVCMALNVTPDELIVKAVGRLLAEYDNRPFDLLAD